MKSVKSSDHADEKMRVRSVKTSDVYATLSTPDQLFEDIEHGTMIGIKKVNGNSIIIAYKLENNVLKL